MAHIIDSVGGIEVDITQAEVTNANGSIAEQAMVTGTTPDYIQQAGLQTLNGMQAVAYARIRYVDNPNGQFGDFGRTRCV